MKRKEMTIYILLLLPFLDLITAIITRYYNFSLTPGVIVKGLLIITFLFYVLILSQSKYKKPFKALIALIFIYFLFYFLTKPELLSTRFIFSEFTYLLKLIYFPIIFMGILSLYDEDYFDNKDLVKYLKYTLIIYIFLLLIPLLTNTAHDTYHYHLKGKIGWFYSGNEISTIMVLLLPFAYCFMNKKQKYNILIFLPLIFVILNIGTKVSFLGLYIVLFITLIFSLYERYKSKNKYYYKPLIILMLAIIFSYNSFTIQNYRIINNPDINFAIEEPIIIDEENKEEVDYIVGVIDNFYLKNKFNHFLKKILSGRDIYLANTLSIYNNDSSNSNIFFGIGFSNTSKVGNSNIQKLIEIDVLDGFFHYGIIGLLIMLSPFIITFYLIKNSRKKITLLSIYYILIIFLALGISSFAGHVLTAPAVSFYLIFYLLLLLNEFEVMGRNHPLKKKISILSLHLGYGGIERAVVNQANMLCEKYEVEIVCLYKVIDKIPYKLNEEVKVIYLSDVKPNKYKFMEYFNQKKVLKTFKEGLKSLSILHKKNSLIKNYIYNSDSKVIISTRIDFTKKLNKYGNKDCIKVAEEHVHHHNNEKYFKQLKNALKNIDYLLPTSKYLTEDYKKFLKNENVKVIYIPNIISVIPSKLNKLNNQNILAVGRLSPEKAYMDLIDVFKLVYTKNPSIKLTIVGDGIEKKLLNKKIKDLRLKSKIKITGFLDYDDLDREYQKASLFVMTSLEESFGLVLIEAMSYGVPCIAFDSALGAKEIINGKNGLLISDRNKESMANEIIKYFNYKDKSKLGKEAKKTSEQYDFDNVQKLWEGLFDKHL